MLLKGIEFTFKLINFCKLNFPFEELKLRIFFLELTLQILYLSLKIYHEIRADLKSLTIKSKSTRWSRWIIDIMRWQL